MGTWIDFDELRKMLNFEQVLQHYGVEIKRKGQQHLGFCPLPGHQGKRRSPSFSANLERGIFQCFGCGAKGNVLEFTALMEKVDPHDGKALREVAMKLQEHFCPELPLTPAEKQVPVAKSESTTPTEPDLPCVINATLDFELKGLDYSHPYLLGRGFTKSTIEQFGVGYTSRGFLKGRIAIPLHDQAGGLIGYAGRIVDDAIIDEENPKYRLPTRRERSGVIHEFRKTMFLYNGFRMTEPLDELIVVEGFPSVWWLTQCGFPHVVSTMGADCSDHQAEMVVSLVKPSGRVWIMPDGDESGLRCATALLLKVSPHRLVRWAKLPVGNQPTDLTAELLQNSFTL